MKTELHGYWVDICFYNSDFSDSTLVTRSDMVCLDIRSRDIYGSEKVIFDVKLYPEDLENLLLAIPPVLREALDLRQRFDSNKKLNSSEITKVTIESLGYDLYNVIRDNLRKEYEKKFREEKWFDVPRNQHGVSDTWGQSDIFEEFMPFLAWDSDLSEAILVTKDWKETSLYHDISWLPKYTQFRGITSPV